GFIVEGDTEKILLESPAFKNLLTSLEIDHVANIVNVVGNNNLLPHLIQEHSNILYKNGAEKIVILTDLDEDLCVSQTKERISPQENHFCVISKKTIEAWFLADQIAFGSFLGITDFTCDNPEGYKSPFEEIKRLRLEYLNRGVNDKKILARIMLYKSNFSFERAANHPNCTSAKYFIEKLKLLSKKN
ncbi:MAG: hypothetical protein IAF38_13705, partial [Bacteroidia bacterium]|nr:hypothetical protein [Bacteroidia bacterium]